MSIQPYTDVVAKAESIEGWYGHEGMAMNEFFMTMGYFPELGMVGDLAEIGVYKGRSAVHLASHCRQGEKLYLFDPYDQMPAVAQMVQDFAPQSKVIGHRGYSQLITDSIIPPKSVRFLRIDGNHTRRAIRADLEVANRILAENGIINMDDFFHPTFAGVTYGTFEWMTEHRGAFEMLLIGFSQAYLCRPSFVTHYMGHMRNMPDFMRAHGVSNFSFGRASSPSDCVTVGITGRLYDRDMLMSDTDYTNVDGPGGRTLEF